jgi:HlyD family secretion protein
MLFKRITFYLAVLGLVSALYLVRAQSQRPPSPPPVSKPARSPYAESVAATGLVEASRENVKLAAPKPGLVTAVAVKVGDMVREGDPLFQLDDRETKARISAAEAQLAATAAQLAVEENQAADARDQFDRYQRLEREKVASPDEFKRREFALLGAEARVASTKAQIKATQALLEQARIEASILTVRAPRDGRILQVNVRSGEFAPAESLAEPLMLLGDVEKLQVRAEVDEQNAVLVAPGEPATAFLKGHSEMTMPLRFLRIEPYVLPKKSLTGDSLERVDTRVLQVIYQFDRPEFPVYVGQQVDVFIRRPQGGAAASRGEALAPRS